MTINITCRILFFIFAIICVRSEEDDHFMSKEERIALREESRKMFYHAYDAYMENAYPADELMPLSCTGRWKGITPSRGDMDDALGNFSLTLVDSLDTLVVMGDFAEFSRAIKLVIDNVTFDSDIVVSVFETNIRMLGGLLSAHVLAKTLQCEVPVLEWYNDELLDMAEDLGNRLLPAFNTSTGIPHGRVNLRYGIQDMSDSRETCTACAGTMIMEMAALSRLTGNSIFEQKAHKAMDRLWKIRHRTSDLMGTVINIHSGDWVRKDSGVGAGIDSYYEYCLKAYILLGDKKYFNRFNRHYNAVMKYINRGPILLAVHMHRPQLQSRNFMDALLAFWPGLQVLLGDMRPAVETHEMLYQVMQRHTFIPEAFTPDLQVHWGQHPLRPEFLESTYFLHRATNDDYYLIVGKQVLKALQLFAKVPCGYAAVNDVRTRVHEDRMDSFVLAETFKYLYMLFAEDKDLPINIEDYVLTTEAHFLPLSLATNGKNITHKVQLDDDEDKIKKVCPSTASIIAAEVREPLRALLSPKKRDSPVASLKPINEPRQLNALSELGISVVTLLDGRVQLLYAAVLAKSAKDAAEGLTFMKDIAKWNQINEKHNGVIPIGVKVGDVVLMGGPSTMGKEIAPKDRYKGRAVMVFPVEGCSPLNNPEEVDGRIAIARRGKCPFSRKAKNLQAAGASLMIILDNVPGTSKDNSPLFSMTNDVHDEIKIPSCFLFSLESSILMTALNTNPYMEIVVGEYNSMKDEYGEFCESGSCKATFESLPRDLTEAHASLRSKTKIRTRTEFEVNVSKDNKVSLIESSEREGKKTAADLEKDAHGQICVANDLLSDKISCREPDEPKQPGNPDDADKQSPDGV